MYIRYGMLADFVARGERGKKNVIGIFDLMWSETFPFRYDRFTLFLRLEGDQSELGKHQLQLHFVDADFHKLTSMPALEIELTNEGRPVVHAPLGAEISANIGGLSIPAAGDYEFVVEIDGRHIGSVPLYVAVGVAPKP